jgi:hypothetical protein
VSHYLVEIHGNAYRAMGLLAKGGIQNVVSRDNPTRQVAARVSSETAEDARGRVLAALMGEPFTVQAARLESVDVDRTTG